MVEDDEIGLRKAALRALHSLDLTNLEHDCDEAAIQTLARRAITAHGNVAAVCVWPRFVGEAHRLLAHQGVRIATVVNFPAGDDDPGEIADLTETAVEAGAGEIDMVIPYKAFLEGREERVITLVKRVRRAAGRGVLVKAILETGVLEREEAVRRAAELALEGGADFLKTSTGKTPVSATLRAARTMLEAIRDSEAQAGLKPSGREQVHRRGQLSRSCGRSDG